MPAEPELLHVMHVKQETVHVMPAVPVSWDKMAAAPESALNETALIIVTMAILCVWAVHILAPLPVMALTPRLYIHVS